MRYFAYGLIIGMLGAILWIAVSFVGALVTWSPEGARDMPLFLAVLMGTGFFGMIGGPLVFWILLPIYRLVRWLMAR